MNRLLAETFEKVSLPSEDLQDQLAQELMEEMSWEAQWDQTLGSSQDKLDRLAEKAEREYRAGQTKEMGFDDL